MGTNSELNRAKLGPTWNNNKTSLEQPRTKLGIVSERNWNDIGLQSEYMLATSMQPWNEFGPTRNNLGTQLEQHRNNIGTNSEQSWNTEQHRKPSDDHQYKLGAHLVWSTLGTHRNNIGQRWDAFGTRFERQTGQHRNNIRTTLEQHRNNIGTRLEHAWNNIGTN